MEVQILDFTSREFLAWTLEGSQALQTWISGYWNCRAGAGRLRAQADWPTETSGLNIYLLLLAASCVSQGSVRFERKLYKQTDFLLEIPVHKSVQQPHGGRCLSVKSSDQGFQDCI